MDREYSLEREHDSSGTLYEYITGLLIVLRILQLQN